MEHASQVRFVHIFVHVVGLQGATTGADQRTTPGDDMYATWAESLERSVHHWTLTKSAFAGCRCLTPYSGHSVAQILTYGMREEMHVSER